MIEHPEAERVDPIAGDVHAIWRDSHERYGARKIKAALERRGVTASRRRIVNIMKRRGMTSAYARRTFKPHKTRVNEARLANILDREFDGYEPRTHLASDLTYVRVGGKWAYVCLLIDLANRSIAGHSADTSRTADLVMAAFATLDFPLTEVEVFHTDRGSEFDNAKIDELLDVFDIRRSLSRKGNPYDNAVVESTNRLLKKELIYRNHYAPTSTTMCGGSTTKDSTPPSDTGVRRNSPNRDSSSKNLSNTPLPVHWSEPPLVPAQYFPGVRGRLWERRRLARLKRSWLDDGAYGYDGPREWHPHIVGQYLPEEEMAERVHRAVPAIGVALLIGAGVLMGRMLS